MYRSAADIVEEVNACICCSECLRVCPALADALPVKALNLETVHGPSSAPVIAFAQNCYQCGACVPVCPVGLHRDAMMLLLKVRLLGGDSRSRSTAAAGRWER